MDTDETVVHPPFPDHATDLLAMTRDLERTQPLPGVTDPKHLSLRGRFHRWASSANATDAGDDLELRYRHWSCCS